jgi:16S rRNA processing protein RimM
VIVTVGRVGRAHGIRGEVTVDVRTDTPDERFADGAMLMTDPEAAGPLTVTGTRWHSGRLLVRFAGVPDRTAAEALRGVVLNTEIAADDHPDDPDEYFDHQLVGLEVVTRGGEVVGSLTDVVHAPGQDLLVVGRSDRPELLVPFVAAIVPEVDVRAGRLVIDPPDGLLDLTEPEESDEQPGGSP